ncbi:MAG TPA: PD-(D/E)XK nuclease family protein, partial [Candidatus Dormibacteraeota bacterium]|nr:PD-(D/E)XK nuclease family protein [Candidatus Dormibacteraeota bacterium]
ALLEAVAAHSAVTVAEVAVAVDGSQPFAPGDVAPRVMIAPEPVAEVRAAVRDLLAAAERPAPIPLHRTAIVYGDEETYAALVRDTLDEAGVAFASLDGRRLADTTPARGLLGLIRLRDLDFTRAAVLAWLSGLPHRGSGVLRSQARWDHLSRDAGVVRGAAQWRDRLERYAQGRERALAGLESDEEEAAVEARRSALRHEIDDARAVAVHVAAIDAATAPPAEPAWTAHVEWALRLRDEFLTPDVWSDADREASQMVEEVVRALAAAEAVEPAVSIRLFLRSLEEGLRSRRLPEGRLGGGVVIGPPGLLLGMELARVHVLGAVEGGLPAPAPVDPLLPGDPLGRQATREAEQRRDWLATLAVADGGEVVVSAPAVDAEGRAVYPSPWLLELLAEGGVAPRATEVRAGTFAHPRVERTGGGPGAPRAAPLSIAERREAEAMAGVAGSALAGRADLPLGRLLAVAGARRSPELTEFDGDLAEVGDLDLVARGLCGAVQSATGIETWATCPFHFLLGRVLAVRPTEDVDDDRWWQIDAAERGLLVHAILETFFTEVAKTGQPRPGEHYTDADVARIEAIALRAFGDAEARGVVGHPLVWANERSAILADLRSLLREDAGRRGDGGWRPSRLEQPFGIEGDARSWPAVEVALDAGRTVTLRGFIDRIDVDGAGTPRVIDYKTGTNSRPDVSAKSRFDGGRRLQLPLYGRAVRDDLRRQGMLPMAARATYWYATAKGGFDQVGLDVDGGVEDTLSEVLRLVDAGVRAGCFPQEPGEFLEYFARYANCGFCPYDTLCPAGRDVLAAAKAGSPALQPYHALRPPVGDGS